jgi:hypothetical protein
MIIECIKGGFQLAHRNLPLVFVRILVTVINLIALIFFLAIPLIIAVIYLGFDLAHARDMIPFLAEHPLDFVSRYLGLAVLFIAALSAYAMLAFMLYLYALGGILGCLKNSAVNVQAGFVTGFFFKAANEHFSRLFWLISAELLFMTAIVAVFAIFTGAGVVILHSLSGEQGTLETFFRSFAAVFIVIMSIIMLCVSAVFVVYSIVISVMEEKGVMQTIRTTYEFFRQRPQAILFYPLLVLGIAATYLLFYGLQIPLHIVPFMTIATYLVNTLFQSYLAIVLWSSLLQYYVIGSRYPVRDAEYEI